MTLQLNEIQNLKLTNNELADRVRVSDFQIWQCIYFYQKEKRLDCGS